MSSYISTSDSVKTLPTMVLCGLYSDEAYYAVNEFPASGYELCSSQELQLL